MKTTLTVENFGPIKKLTVSFDRYLVLIGQQGTGKSIVAKLMHIFKNPDFLLNSEMEKFLELLQEHRLHFYLKTNTSISYAYGPLQIKIKNKKLKSNIQFPAFTGSIADQAFRSSVANIPAGDKKVWPKAAVENYLQALFEKLENDKDEEIKEWREEIKAALEHFRQQTKSLEEPVVAYKSRPAKKKKVSEGKDVPASVSHFSFELELFQLIFRQKPFLENSTYFPSERTFFSTVEIARYDIMSQGLSLPKPFLKFGQQFLNAKRKLEAYKVPFFKVEFVPGATMDEIAFEDGQRIPFANASSGLQNLVPLSLVFDDLVASNGNHSYTIEEPELGLYPVTQKDLIYWLVEKCNEYQRQLIITTHSPYVLTSFSNLLFAFQAGKKKPRKTNSVVPRILWIDIGEFSCYKLENGGARSIMDYEEKIIDAKGIDEASTIVNEEFEKLFSILYR